MSCRLPGLNTLQFALINLHFAIDSRRRPGSTWRSFYAEEIHSLEGVLISRLAWFPSIGSSAMWNMA
ncbi:hypothetical protein, partial [Rhodopirellula sp. UBA1907]|uniref:hypothetical protein n=1 Tax=Rhodopirellula sp. UBA1907 TaxID=1947381 RepID=UPI00257F7C0E